jgi:type IX secretion system PorP/SprF family membrane protein
MKKIIKILSLLLIPVGAFAQLAPVTSQYILNPLIINPAFAGNRGALNISAFFRRQWVGIPGAPETTSFIADAPMLDNKIGLGISLINDRVGVTKETQFVTNYAYKLNLGKGTLSLGLGAGFTATNTAWSDLIVLDPGDEAYLVDTRLFVIPNFSFGAYYSYDRHFAGFSIPRFLSYSFSSDKNKYTAQIDPAQYSYMFMYGYIFDLSDKVNFIPSTLISLSPGRTVLIDVNGYFTFNNRFWVGASYKNGRSFAGLLQFEINNQLRIAYSYDFDFGKLGTYSNGSHEIMLRYEFRYKVDVPSPLIF